LFSKALMKALLSNASTVLNNIYIK